MARSPLYSFTDPLDLPRITPRELHGGHADGVWLEGDGTQRRFSRAAPAFHDDPDGARLFAGFGDETIVYPPAFLTSWRRARLVGFRMTLTPDGRCFTDESIPPAARPGYVERLGRDDADANEQTGLVPSPEPGQFRLQARGRKTTLLPGRAIVLCSGEPYNFGSFLFRVLPKLHAIRRYDLGHLPVLVHEGAATEQQYLDLAGIRADALIRHDPRRIYSIDQAIRPSLRNPQAFLDDESRAVLAGLRDRYGRRERSARLYVSRLGHSQRGGSGRVMTNEAALIERLRALGFLIVEPESLSARAQIEIFSSAALVVGPSGAGMFNVVFCHPGTRVIDIESEPHWIHAHSCLFASCQHRYGIIEGKVDATDTRPVHRRWAVNIEAVCDRIAAFDAPSVIRRDVPAPVVRRAGTLDRVTPTHAHGWARDEASPQPAEVEITVDGRPAGRVRADQPRGDLAAMGHCAFSFPFPAGLAPLRVGAAVGARFADTGVGLVHSPRMVT